MKTRSWPDEPTPKEWVLDMELDDVRCYVYDGEGAEVRMIRRIPEPVPISELVGAVSYLAEKLGGDLGGFSDGLREGRLDFGDFGALGFRVRRIPWGSGMGWSCYAVQEHWLAVFLEAVTWCARAVEGLGWVKRFMALTVSRVVA